jgi:hypothetical protein
MPESDEGYKCSCCGETFSKSSSAKKHVNFSKKCRSADGTFSKVIIYKIVTSRLDRRVGGREIINDPSDRIDEDQVVNDQLASGNDSPVEHDEFSLEPATGNFFLGK